MVHAATGRSAPSWQALAVVVLVGVLGCLGACGAAPPAVALAGPDAGVCTETALRTTGDAGAQREKAFERWGARGPAHYRFVWMTSAMVGQTRIVVEVRDRRVVSTTVLQADRNPDDRRGRTVEDLFTELRDAQQHADAVTVTYDPTLCYPTQVQVDQQRKAIDDEHSFAIEDLRPL